MRKLVFLLGFAVPLLAAASGFAQTACENLKSLSLPNTTITTAEVVPAGPFGAGGRQQGRGIALPAHCRVAAVLKPSSDSDIEMEVWLPSDNWNGNFQAVGNGGWAGSISLAAMAQALQQGYATASTDTGHKSADSPGAEFALGHPEKVVDFGWRAVHEMTVESKAIIDKFYGRGPHLSYWNGCSNGGRQGLMEAQRFPADYDGILAGSPGVNWTGRAAQSLYVGQAAHKDEASFIPPAKYGLIHSAVLEACDLLDGVKDGLIENPLRCQFDPGKLQCKDADGPSCLTAAQVQTARTIYTAVTDPRSKKEIYPGLEPGSELGWATYAGPRPFAIGDDYFKYVVFKNADWDYRTFDFAKDLALAEKIDHGTIDALDPNLKPFFARGGKIVQSHGWSDPQIPPLHSVNYYKSVIAASGGIDAVRASYRLFMVPAMAHCGGGEGPNVFDAFGAVVQWVEKAQAPDQIVASRINNGNADRTRPLCPYPQVAVYKSDGSIDDAANFVCKAQ